MEMNLRQMAIVGPKAGGGNEWETGSTGLIWEILLVDFRLSKRTGDLTPLAMMEPLG